MRMGKFLNGFVAATMLATAFSSTALARGGDRHNDNYGDRYNDRRETKRVVLNYYDEHFRGEQTLRLKRKFNQEGDYVNLDRFKLKSARLVAKTKHGKGNAYLAIGQKQSMSQRIDGNPRDFRDNARYTFDRKTFMNPSRSDDGRWQFKLRGNFVVRKVVLIFEKMRRYDHDDDYYYNLETKYLGEKRFPKFLEVTKTFDINLGNVKRLTITANRNEIDVEMAKVVFGNGETRYLSELEGFVREGRSKSVSFYAPQGRNVQKLVISATSPDIAGGSRGKLELTAQVKVRR